MLWIPLVIFGFDWCWRGPSILCAELRGGVEVEFGLGPGDVRRGLGCDDCKCAAQHHHRTPHREPETGRTQDLVELLNLRGSCRGLTSSPRLDVPRVVAWFSFVVQAPSLGTSPSCFHCQPNLPKFNTTPPPPPRVSTRGSFPSPHSIFHRPHLSHIPASLHGKPHTLIRSRKLQH